MKKIYLDDAATTRVFPEVVKEMEKFYLEKYGNPSSLHEMGEIASRAINEARKKFAEELNCKSSEIYFTSGATESNNTALKGLWKLEKKKIIISKIEHPSVKEVAESLKRIGVKIVETDIEYLEKEIDKNTALVSFIHANNITGEIQDLMKIGGVCKKKGVLFHTDATQSFGKIKIDVRNMNIDMLSASAHKIGGPKGVGLLYIREGVKLNPLIIGGEQEAGLRSGTENVPGIIGFTKALELNKKININKIRKLRIKLIESLMEIGGKINSPENGLLNIINVSFDGINNETLVYRLSHKGIYVSSGSACESKKKKEDYVLMALGLNKKEIEGSIRICLNDNIIEKDVDYVVREIEKCVNKLKF